MLGRFVAQVLETDRKLIEENLYFAWDPLATVTLVEPGVVVTRPAALEVRQKPPEELDHAALTRISHQQ